jgi:hypothetical protein
MKGTRKGRNGERNDDRTNKKWNENAYGRNKGRRLMYQRDTGK